MEYIEDSWPRLAGSSLLPLRSIHDIKSRYVVGRMLDSAEKVAALAGTPHQPSAVASRTCEADELAVHADRRSSMRSLSVAFLLAGLAVEQNVFQTLRRQR